jgi:hypothetical protein
MPIQPPIDTQGQGARQRNPRLLILLLVALCVIFVAGYFERLARLEETRQNVDAIRQQVAASRQRHANLQAELERAQDPYYLALLARDGIGLRSSSMRGRRRWRSRRQRKVTDPPGVKDKPPWQQWWELIFQ